MFILTIIRPALTTTRLASLVNLTTMGLALAITGPTFTDRLTVITVASSVIPSTISAASMVRLTAVGLSSTV